MAKEVPADELAARRLARERAVKEAKKRLKQEDSDDSDLSEKQLTNKLCMELADLIGGGVLGFKCHVYEDEKGARKPLLENDRREVAFVEAEKITSAIFQHVRQKALFDSRYLWNMREVESCYSMWLRRQDTLRDVKMFDWLSGEGLTFKRLAFDFERKESYPHPTWDKILGNIEYGRDVFKQFIGSIFVPESYRQQYLWLQGTGGDGKGTLLKCLNNVLGNSNCVSVSENITDQFWAENLETARIAYFDDCKNTSLPSSQRLLEITGRDQLIINKKGIPKFSVKNDIKIIFTSNYMPSIQEINRDLRRCLIVAFKRKDGVVADDPMAFEKAVMNEFSDFISDCVATYLDANPNHQPITLDEASTELVSNIGLDTDANFQAIIDQFFELQAIEKSQNIAGYDRLDYKVKDTRFTAYMAEVKLSKAEISAIRRWLTTRWGVMLKSTKKDKVKGRYYIGIREKLPKFTFSEWNTYRHGAKG